MTVDKRKIEEILIMTQADIENDRIEFRNDKLDIYNALTVAIESVDIVVKAGELIERLK